MGVIDMVAGKNWFWEQSFLCLIWNHSPTRREAKPEEGVPGRGIIGTAQGQGVYIRGRLHNGASTTPIFVLSL
jgi:hypothetical protein